MGAAAIEGGADVTAAADADAAGKAEGRATSVVAEGMLDGAVATGGGVDTPAAVLSAGDRASFVAAPCRSAPTIPTPTKLAATPPRKSRRRAVRLRAVVRSVNDPLREAAP